MKIPVHAKLRLFVKRICNFIKDEPDLSMLVQREILDEDGDKIRLRLLADQVFQNFFRAAIGLVSELAPDKDPHLLVISIFSMIVYHYQTKPIRLFLPGAKPEHNDSQVIADYITDLLLLGLKR